MPFIEDGRGKNDVAGVIQGKKTRNNDGRTTPRKKQDAGAMATKSRYWRGSTTALFNG
ncbi:hypothetical protein [Mixta gaviniae]|uniref:hypothetical protein n=1 Tax=Mixta gaviniae TaxID=665914 RepID=UPI00142D21A9|nr:hypothetical protein [Mixta gaviniae]